MRRLTSLGLLACACTALNAPAQRHVVIAPAKSGAASMAMASALAASVEGAGGVATIVDASSRKAVRDVLPALPVTHCVDAWSVTDDDVSALFLEVAGSELECWCCCASVGAAGAAGRSASDVVSEQLGPDVCRIDAFGADATSEAIASQLAKVRRRVLVFP